MSGHRSRSDRGRSDRSRGDRRWGDRGRSHRSRGDRGRSNRSGGNRSRGNRRVCVTVSGALALTIVSTRIAAVALGSNNSD